MVYIPEHFEEKNQKEIQKRNQQAGEVTAGHAAGGPERGPR